MNLWPFQREGVAFLLKNPRAYLADGMGLGKTVQAAVAARLGGYQRTLVVCPASAVENWKREWLTWGPKLTLAVVSYAQMIRRAKEFVGGDWDLLILDEAHYVKTPSAQRTKVAMKLASKVSNVWLLSGTPMPNHPGELWTIMRYIWPEIPQKLNITNAWEWFDRFCRWSPTQYGPRVHGTKNKEVLLGSLAQIMRRRTIESVGLQLPPLRVDVSLLPKTDSLNLSAYADAAAEDAPAMSTLRRLLGEYKAPRIGKIIHDELLHGAYRKIVVLAHHRATLRKLGEILAAFNVIGFDGSTPQKARQFAIDEFNTNADCRVFLAQQSAAGIAINLTAGTEIVLVEPAWSPEDNAQAIKRIHRIGQHHPCRARIFAIADTLDDGIMHVLAEKTRMIADVIPTEGSSA